MMIFQTTPYFTFILIDNVPMMPPRTTRMTIVENIEAEVEAIHASLSYLCNNVLVRAKREGS
jgi:hypothetical protein